MDATTPFQEQGGGHLCWGCGHLDDKGLQLKSHWGDDGTSVARWHPSPEHAAGPPTILNGGIIATLLDCHGVATAGADAYRQQDREIGTLPHMWYATTRLDVRYLRPTRIDAEVALVARVTSRDDARTVLQCTLSADGKERATALVEATRVPDTWTGW